MSAFYGNKLSDFIKAMQIFCKYKDDAWPFLQNSDEGCVMLGITPDMVSEQDTEKLKVLHFNVDKDYNNDPCFMSQDYFN